jgi:thiol-disulfide isomerase/thioredoxin
MRLRVHAVGTASSADLQDEVSLVNAFASWCMACRCEHPLFMQLEENGVVPIHGLNYKGPRTPRNGSMTSTIPTPGRQPISRWHRVRRLRRA